MCHNATFGRPTVDFRPVKTNLLVIYYFFMIVLLDGLPSRPSCTIFAPRDCSTMHDEGFGLPHLSLCCRALLSSLTSPRAYRIQSTMKSIAGSTNAAIVALVVARSSRAVTAFQPGSGRLFSSRAGATTGRGMHGLAMSTAAAAVMGVASSRCAHEMLDEGMLGRMEGVGGGRDAWGVGKVV